VALRFDEIPEELLPGGYLFTDREDNPAVHGDEKEGGESYFDPAWDAVRIWMEPKRRFLRIFWQQGWAMKFLFLAL